MIVIQYHYSPDSIGDVPHTAFEAELYDRLKARWPGALLDVTAALTHGPACWGQMGDEDIPEEELRRLGEEAFAACLAREVTHD